ncbi:hypothetical protein KEM56_000357 [Ascosphaera pollenicola]|nr:hypothetical protein KEM56_000357 [Ascosphaera pollenicola]
MLTYYTETRVDVKSTTPGTVVDIAASRGGGARRWNSSSVNSSPGQQGLPRDEKSFAARYVASQSSLYFRDSQKFPRAFLWRVLNNDRVLEIRSVDVARSSYGVKEADVVLRFYFTEAILPNGVTITDRNDSDSLSVFVLTGGREAQMYTLTLKPEFFQDATLVEEACDDISKSYKAPQFSVTQPHRIYAKNSQEVFVSLTNGTLLRLRRRANSDGSNWALVTFDEKPWGFRGLLSWNKNQLIKHNGQSFDLRTTSAIAVSPDETFIFVVELNHTLKVWNLAGQQLIASKDLLGKKTGAEIDLARTLNPADAALIRVFSAERAADDASFYVVTYSPHEGGQFKFWAIRGGVMTDLYIEDMFPNTVLKPEDPDPTGGVFWNIADFQIKPTTDGRRMTLWVLWKNNNLHRVFTLHFDLDSLEDAWQTNWISSANEASPDREPLATEEWDVEDPSEKWTEYLFGSERYSEEALTTALLMYQEATNHESQSSPKTLAGKSLLKQQMKEIVSQTVILRESNGGNGDEINYSKYRNDVDSRWRQIWQIVEDISKLQKEALSLTYDTLADAPWLAFSDGCGAVRECSNMELLLYNTAEDLHQPNESFGVIASYRDFVSELGPRPAYVSALLHLATSLTKDLPPQFLEAARTALNVEIFDDPSMSASERIERFYMLSQFEDLIPDDLAADIETKITKNLTIGKQTTDVFMAAVAILPHRLSRVESQLVSTPFGRSLLMRGIHDRVLLTQEVLISLLLVAIFIEMEMQPEDNSFEGKWVFTTLVENIKEYDLLRWLLSKRQTITPQEDSNMTISSPPQTVQPKAHNQTVSLLEDLFLSKTRPQPAVNIPQTWTITKHTDDLVALILKSGPVPVLAVTIQCDLLANGNLSTAMDFLRFQPNNAWSTYVKGRLYLAQADYTTAALCFQKASYLMSHGKPQGDLVELSSSLIDPVTANYFYNGLTFYYQHILDLFEQARAFTYVADFAQLALQALQTSGDWKEDSHEYPSTRTDLLSRLFYASLQASRYDEAWSALDLAIQGSTRSFIFQLHWGQD